MTTKIVLFISLVGAMFLFGVSVHAQGYGFPPPPPSPPMVIEEDPPAVVVVPPRPGCHVVRETKHDDILDTNDWVEHEECD